MVKCKACGELNLDNSRFCAACGKPLSEATGNAMKEALEKAQKNFEKDALATIDRSRITFVCTVCGTVNSIDQERCSKCGKPRPRSEFVNALKKVKQGYEYREEPVVETPIEQKPVEEIKQETPPVEEVVVQQPKPVPQVVTEAAVIGGGGQANPVVQPFIVVPFVNPNQEIWQYKQNQVYRFQPYSEEEMSAMEREKANQQKAIQEANALAESYGIGALEKTEDDINFNPKAKPIRFVALLVMLLSLAAVVVSFLVNIFEELYINANLIKTPVVFFASGIVEFFKVQFNLFTNANFIGYAYETWTDLIAPVGFILFLVSALVLIIRSFARLLMGTAKRKGWFLPLMVVLLFLTGLVGLINKYHEFSMEGLKAFYDNFGLGMYILGGIVILLFIVSLFSPSNVAFKRSKKDLK